jgi:hypothetical protein
VNPWRIARAGIAPVRAAGQATVELAVLLPVLALLGLTVAQVALVARDRVLVTHAAREGVRVAAVGGGDAEVRAAVREAGSLDATRLRVRVARGADTVEVWVDYRSVTDLAVVGRLVADVDMTARATMRREDPP